MSDLSSKENSPNSIIQNEAGIPGSSIEAKAVREAHRTWKKQRNKRKTKKGPEYHYWQNISACSDL